MKKMNFFTKAAFLLLAGLTFWGSSAFAQPGTAAPTPPALDAAKVKSVFSEAFTAIPGAIDFDPNWGQATDATIIDIGGSQTLKYANLNQQGTDFTAFDATGMVYMHIDMWTADETSVNFYPICTGDGGTYGNEPEKFVTLTPIVANAWNSYDILISDFTDQGLTMQKVHQFKFVGSGGKTIYLDNLYFYDNTSATDAEEPAAFTAIKGAANYFDIALKLNATDNSGIVKYTISYGTTTLTTYGTSGVEKTYVVKGLTAGTDYSFSITAKDATGNSASNSPITVTAATTSFPAAPATPALAAYKVKSIFSDAFAETGTTFDMWGSGTQKSIVQLTGNNALKYTTLQWTGIILGQHNFSLGMKYLHIDAYTTDLTTLNVYPICSNGSGGNETEKFKALTLTLNSWNSFDIPITDFTSQGLTMNDVYQIKLTGSGDKTVYIDNIYFWTDVDDVDAPTAFTATKDQVTFQSVKLLLNATDNSGGINYEITYGGNTFTTTGASATEKPYLVSGLTPSTDYSFSIVAKDAAGNAAADPIVINATTDAVPVAAPVPPAIAANKVISVYSEAYTNVNVLNYALPWGQTTVVTQPTYSGNKVLQYDKINYIGTEVASTNISAMTHIHIDVFSLDVATLKYTPISNLGDAVGLNLTSLPAESWKGYDFPLSSFANFDKNTFKTFKFDQIGGGNTVLIDNIFFYDNTTTDADLAAAKTAESALIAADYADYSAVTAALALPEVENLEKIGKTVALNAAIAGLVNFSAALTAAKDAAALLTPADYLDFAPVTAALALSEGDKAEMIAKTTAITSAIAALVTIVDDNLAKAKAAEALLDASIYSNYNTVTTALAMPETNNAEKIAKTDAINSAIAGLLIPVASVSFNVTTLDLLAKGATETLIASILPSNASNENVTYSSSVEAVATVDADGVVTPLAAGTTVITVTTVDGAKTATCTVTVTNVDVASVSILPATLNLAVGSVTGTLAATILPANASNKAVVWSTSDAAIATVDASGVVTPVAVGSATITATTVDGAKTATCAVTVVATAVNVTSISVLPTTMSLNLGGETDTIVATILPVDATNVNVTWSSSDEAVATVSSIGVVTPVANGTATITVTTADGSFTATCAVTVASVPVASVSIAPTTLNFTVGGATSILTTTILPSNASNKAKTYSSSNTSVATVSALGVVTPVAAGTATITVTTADGAKTATCAVTVVPASILVTGVTLDQTTLSLTVGAATGTLVATIAPANATNKALTFSTSDAAIATVNTNGVVTPVAAGTATITVTTTDGAKTATCVVTVAPAVINVTGVTLDKTTLSLTAGGATASLVATIAPANASNKNVTFASNATGVATVSSTGVVTPVAAGTATITVTSAEGAKTATCVVTVAAAPIAVTGVSLSKSTLDLKVGGATASLVATIAPATATNKAVTFSTSDAAIATVSDKGVVTPVAAGTATITVTSADGAKTATCTVTVTLESVIAGTSTQSVSVYPNPSTGVINVKSIAGSTISIFDVLGKEVLKVQSSDNVNSINLSNKSKGLYSVKVTSNGTTNYFKVILK